MNYLRNKIPLALTFVHYGLKEGDSYYELRDVKNKRVAQLLQRKNESNLHIELTHRFKRKHKLIYYLLNALTKPEDETDSNPSNIFSSNDNIEDYNLEIKTIDSDSIITVESKLNPY